MIVLSNPIIPFFVVDEDYMLQPLRVRVSGDSREELLPSTRDYTEEISGRDGEYDFGSEFKARALELAVVTRDKMNVSEKKSLKRSLAKYLDPTKGYLPLQFADEPDLIYMVKYSGKIDITNHPTWFQFTIPFKMENPFMVGLFEKTMVGAGMAINDGNYETGLKFEIKGPAVNPQVSVGDKIFFYEGEIPAGQTLYVDTFNKTIRLNDVNAIDRNRGVFPLLNPGETNIFTSINTTIKWRDKWI